MTEPYYAAALYAYRVDDEIAHIGATVAVVHPLVPQVTGDELALSAARDCFPPSDGWVDHYAVAHSLGSILVDTIAVEAGLPPPYGDGLVSTHLIRVHVCDHCGARTNRIDPDIMDEP